MSLIILPSGIHTPPRFGGRVFEPGYIPRAPLCQTCGDEATPDNPVGVTLRKAWDPRVKGRCIDAECVRCRERRGR
jgi:hypothetical protein